MKLPDYADPDALAHIEAKKQAQLADKDFLEKASCCICFSNLANAVIMNCGHGGICYECGKSILQSNVCLCHLCREPLLFVLQLDLQNSYQNFINVVSATYVEDSDSDDNGDNNVGVDGARGENHPPGQDGRDGQDQAEADQRSLSD